MESRVGVRTLGNQPLFRRKTAQASDVLELLAHLVGCRARLFPQTLEERIEQSRVEIPELTRALGNEERVETHEMRRKTLGECCGEVDASARRRLGIEHDQQVFVAHERLPPASS